MVKRYIKRCECITEHPKNINDQHTLSRFKQNKLIIKDIDENETIFSIVIDRTGVVFYWSFVREYHIYNDCLFHDATDAENSTSALNYTDLRQIDADNPITLIQHNNFIIQLIKDDNILSLKFHDFNDDYTYEIIFSESSSMKIYKTLIKLCNPIASSILDSVIYSNIV
jgi:hypothetical protein